jgi:hypothetical protein
MKPQGWRLAALLVLFVTEMFAQQSSGTITGTVSDQQRAVVPAARVQVTNTATNAVFAATTNESGLYIVPGLPVGIYEISAESEGFKKALRSGVTLQVNQTAQVDLTLEVGALAEVVEVTGEARS